MDFSKLRLRETLEQEKVAAEKAAMSGEKQKATGHALRQKTQMAQKTNTSKKSDVVYASEEYFAELRDKVELHKAHEAARYDWRKNLQEGRPPKEDPEGNHPYVSIMPMTNSKAKEVKKKYKENEEKEKMQNPLQQESKMEFDELLTNLIESEKPFDPDARRKQRAANLKNAAKNSPKDTRTDGEKMADATGPRPGSRYRGD